MKIFFRINSPGKMKSGDILIRVVRLISSGQGYQINIVFFFKREIQDYKVGATDRTKTYVIKFRVNLEIGRPDVHCLAYAR